MSKELDYLDDILKNEPLTLNKRMIIECIKEKIQRLEAIDNSNPSEALKCLDGIEYVADVLKVNHKIGSRDIANQEIKEMAERLYYRIPTIKQALLKTEKEHNSVNLLMQELDCKDFAQLRKYARCGYEKLNKKYLKWEDLEFNIDKQMMTVLLNGTKYTLIVGRNVHIDKLAFLRNGEIDYYFLEADKQFFNDLHLERVEE